MSLYIFFFCNTIIIHNIFLLGKCQGNKQEKQSFFRIFCLNNLFHSFLKNKRKIQTGKNKTRKRLTFFFFSFTMECFPELVWNYSNGTILIQQHIFFFLCFDEKIALKKERIPYSGFTFFIWFVFLARHLPPERQNEMVVTSGEIKENGENISNSSFSF